jgi:protein-tyrosine-phosphatase
VSRLKPPDPVQHAGVARGSVPVVPPGKRRVLFVCVGNCIRSQFAEAFARAYGSDVIEAASCGVAPAGFIADPVQRILRERGVPSAGLASKSVYEVGAAPFDIVVNLSGSALPRNFPAPVRERTPREWPVRDPMGLKDIAYEEAAKEIETRVMSLVLELRRG